MIAPSILLGKSRVDCIINLYESPINTKIQNNQSQTNALARFVLQYYKTQFLRKIQEYNIKSTYHKDYYFTNTRSGKRDINKARRLVECLDVIGQNNIRALYVGTSEYSKNIKRPKFTGRLATTIIVEDGLWLG